MKSGSKRFHQIGHGELVPVVDPVVADHRERDRLEADASVAP